MKLDLWNSHCTVKSSENTDLNTMKSDLDTPCCLHALRFCHMMHTGRFTTNEKKIPAHCCDSVCRWTLRLHLPTAPRWALLPPAGGTCWFWGAWLDVLVWPLEPWDPDLSSQPLGQPLAGWAAHRLWSFETPTPWPWVFYLWPPTSPARMGRQILLRCVASSLQYSWRLRLAQFSWEGLL